MNHFRSLTLGLVLVSLATASQARSQLSAQVLLDDALPASPVAEHELAPPAKPVAPTFRLDGVLLLDAAPGNGAIAVLRDDYGYGAQLERGRLPRIRAALVQDGTHLIPARRGVVETDHPVWNYILGPGRVWQAPEDGGYARASLPFALVQKNQNCTHNGTLIFVFSDRRISSAWYQVTQETCAYYKADLWGTLAVSRLAEPVQDAQKIAGSYAAELAGRIATRPIAQLATDHPGTDPGAILGTAQPEHVTTYGLLVGNVHYRGPCPTRYGHYPYCGAMRLASYSTAKSAFAGLATMRLAQALDPALPSRPIAAYIPEAARAASDWSSVTFEHALDMSTGHFVTDAYMQEEYSAGMNAFFLAETYASKVAIALDWPATAPTGKRFVYRTSDTFLLTVALQNFLRGRNGPEADIFRLLVEQVFEPAGLGPGAFSTLRTKEDGRPGQPLGGYGLWWIADDVAKLVRLLRSGGKVNNTQLLAPEMLAAALQQKPSHRGLPTGPPGMFYNNGFWATEFTKAQGFACDFWIPFMSGTSGISVVLMPNGVTFYRFGDDKFFDWSNAMRQAALIAPLCPR